MANENLQPCAFRILRYTPNLIRDEWVNIGVILLDPARKRGQARLIDDSAEFARVRRLHPNADEEVLRALQNDFAAQFAAHPDDPQAFLAKLDETLSNVLQFSPQRAVLTEDFDSEMDRLFREHVEAPRFRLRPAAETNSRNGIRVRVGEVFRSAGIWGRIQRNVRVDEFTVKGDPFHLDFAYQRNGTRGFLHALSLARDPGQAKVLAFTAERIKARLAATEFTAVAEVEPQPGNERHQFVAGLLAERNVMLLSVTQLTDFVSRLRVDLR